VRARIVVDATDPAAVRSALAVLETACWRKRATRFSLDDGPAIDVDWLYNPERRNAWTIVPGLVGVIVMISMLMLGALTLVRERGSWEALLATPVDALDALIGKLAPYVVIGAAQGAVLSGSPNCSSACQPATASGHCLVPCRCTRPPTCSSASPSLP
jgi:ABC-2 type transport system permease protein